MSRSGNFEGKELRFGQSSSALFVVILTDASCGAVNAMHDSLMPIAGMIPMLNIRPPCDTAAAARRTISAHRAVASVSVNRVRACGRHRHARCVQLAFTLHIVLQAPAQETESWRKG